MQIFHFHWQISEKSNQSGEALFWLESDQVQQKKRGLHPYAVADVGAVVEGVFGRKLTLTPTQLSLWLPSTKQPQPSPALRDQRDEDDDDTTPLQWKRWKINAGIAMLPDALTLLLKLPTDAQLPPNVKIGASARYWQRVALLVAEVLAQQNVMPSLVENGTAFEARWLPVLERNDDRSRLSKLRDAMPPVCRAAGKTIEDAPHPTLLLNSFIEQMTDAAFRAWATAPSFSRTDTDLDHKWLQALFNNKPLQGASAQWQHVLGSYRAWTRNLHVAGDQHFRVALHLNAPEGRQRKWRLYYALQAREDPSLVISADNIWKNRFPSELGIPLARPQELLLTGLGYAARFSDSIYQTLQKAKPTQLTLDGDEAYLFLREVAPILEASGFGILVPPWWTKATARLSLKLKLSGKSTVSEVSEVSKGLVSFENLVNYDWQLAIGDTTLSREEFDALVALKSPLVQVRGQWVRLDPEQIEAAINFWDKQQLRDSVNLLDALAMGLDTQGEVGGLTVSSAEFDGWLANWIDQLRGNVAMTPIPPPDNLNATLRPYQAVGYTWLNFLRQIGIGGILADDMGLGKTIQALSLFQQIKQECGLETLPKPILLICPTSVVTNWDKERARFTPNLKALLHQGGDRLRDDQLRAAIAEHDVVLTSFALALRDGETLGQVDWLGVVLDEAQNIKNPNAKRTRMIRSFNADFRFALTGTPVENRLSELWSIMQFLNPDYLGNRKQFRKKFALPIERDHDEFATKRLRMLTQPFLLRRLKTDPTVITDLPEKQEMKVYVHLSAEQATLYETVVQDALEKIAASDGIERRGLVLSMLMKLKQICNHPAQFLHQMGSGAISGEMAARSGKLERLVALLETISAENDHALIFSQFTEMSAFLQRYLREQMGIPALYLHGGTPPAKRATMVERFQNDADAPPVFLLSLKAGGTGLNLTRANHVFHFDRWWNPAVENQATDRAFRIGQKRNVFVHKFVCIGTLEERIDEMIEQKQALADSVVGQGEGWLTDLATDDLRDLVQLRREALA